MKQMFSLILTACFISGLFSCNSNTPAAKEEPAKTADTVAAVATPPPPPPAFKPFDVVEMEHTVKDYAKWRPFFNTDSVNRKAIGLENIVVGRSIDKPNSILIVLQASDMQKAKAFSADPKLKEVMTKAGVISKPAIGYWHVIRFSPNMAIKEWVEVTHKVKDFDAWVKVFDAEGPAIRAAQGMSDAVLSRGIDDPNLVHIVFDITDMAKAKAAIMSEEKKKLMMSAGVEGKPTVKFYKMAE